MFLFDLKDAGRKQVPHFAPPVPVVGHIAAPDLQMGGQSLILQGIADALGILQSIPLVGTLTGAQQEGVFLCLGKGELVGNAAPAQVKQGTAAQDQIVAFLIAPEAA